MKDKNYNPHFETSFEFGNNRVFNFITKENDVVMVPVELLERLFSADWAEDCQECAAGHSDAWKELKALIAKHKEAT